MTDKTNLSPHEKAMVDAFIAQYGPIDDDEIEPVLFRMRKERDRERRIVSRRASGYTQERTQWLWSKKGGRIPLGELTILAGKGGVGKSTILALFSAMITTGTMYGEYYGKPRPVLYVVNEDSISKTVLPRMIAAGADPDLVNFLEVQTPAGQAALSLPRDSERLMDEIIRTNAVATFIDPFSANISGKMNDQGEMRDSFQIVRRIAETSNTAIVGLAHFKKENVTNAIDAIMGSSEQGNVVRAVLAVARHEEKEGTFILGQEKNNLGRLDIPGYEYTIESAETPAGIETSRIEWGDPTMLKASDMMQTAATGQSIGAAMDWLPRYLIESGPTQTDTLKKDAYGEIGVSVKTLDRAAKKLPGWIEKEKGFGKSAVWKITERGLAEWNARQVTK